MFTDEMVMSFESSDHYQRAELWETQEFVTRAHAYMSQQLTSAQRAKTLDVKPVRVRKMKLDLA